MYYTAYISEEQTQNNLLMYLTKEYIPNMHFYAFASKLQMFRMRYASTFEAPLLIHFRNLYKADHGIENAST